MIEEDVQYMNITEVLSWTHKEYRALQPLWDAHLKYEYYVSSPVYPTVFGFMLNFLALVPYTIIDVYGKNWKWIQKYKIQPDKEVTWPLLRKAMALSAWNMLVFVTPLTVFQWVCRSPTFLPSRAPTVFEVVWQSIVALAIFDFQFFVWHYIHHKVRFLYKHTHALHHQYHSPNAWIAQYTHPWELISLGFFSATSPMILKSHPLTEFIFLLLMISASLDAHSGFDFPFMPHRWFPLYGGSVNHDMHHQKPLSNYAPIFHTWDKIFGTYCPAQLAGGLKPKELLDWEKKERAMRQQQREERDRLIASSGQYPRLN